MSVSAQLVWLLISYLATKLASKTWGRVLLRIGRGYLATRTDERADAHMTALERVRPLTPEERARLETRERRTVDHESSAGGTS